MTDTLIRRIAELSGKYPEKLAVVFKKEKLTYKELYDRIRGVAAFLCKKGVKTGDRVCFSAVSSPEMVVTYLGIQYCGGVAVFLDKNGTPQNMRSIYDESNSVLMLTDKPMKEYRNGAEIVSLRAMYVEAMEQEVFSVNMPSPNENDLAELLFTTGTTGKPKGVMLSYKNIYNILRNTVIGINMDENLVMLLPLPLNHSFALRVLRATLYCGATVVLQNGFTFAKESENNISNFGCNAMACVPASYEVMRSQMQDAFVRVMSGLKFIEFGAGSLSVRQRREITSLLPEVRIYNTWGSSESGGAIFCDVTEVSKDPARIGTLGKPLEGKVDVRILSSDGEVIKSSKENPGRMSIKGDMQMMGYWKNEELTAETLKDGWLLTGDMAYLDENGYIYMLGRADDIINVGGEKVSPIEVENIASQYECIKECACIGVEDPDGITGQIPVLFVVPKSGYSEDELHKFISTRAERYKLPQRYVVTMEIPRNRMQKVDRKALREIWKNNSKDGVNIINPVVENILSRHSIRNFEDKEIPEEILNMILKCGYHAPSGHNMQTWRFTVLTAVGDIQKLKEVTKEAAEENKVYFYGWENPKIVILVSNDKRNADGCQDASCAAENMMLAAHSYGIGSVWLNPLMTLRTISPVKEVLDDFGIPENHIIWSAVALGYPKSDEVVLKKKEDVVRFVGVIPVDSDTK